MSQTVVSDGTSILYRSGASSGCSKAERPPAPNLQALPKPGSSPGTKTLVLALALIMLASEPQCQQISAKPPFYHSHQEAKLITTKKLSYSDRSCQIQHLHFVPNQKLSCLRKRLIEQMLPIPPAKLLAKSQHQHEL
jgi:hypothetical protein